MKRAKVIYYWLRAIIWMLIIYYFSEQPNLKSSLPSTLDLILRKIAHVSEFFVLSYFFNKAIHATTKRFGISLFFSAILSLAYAVFDEMHQSFVIGRNSSIFDIAIDSVGIFSFIFLVNIMKRKSAL